VERGRGQKLVTRQMPFGKGQGLLLTYLATIFTGLHVDVYLAVNSVVYSIFQS
jgi:hypothetical protein